MLTLWPRVETLFRVMSPAMCQALAMTEKYEKAERMRIMRESGGGGGDKDGKSHSFPIDFIITTHNHYMFL